jgi:hypothetical protein
MSDREQEARDSVLHEIDGAIEALTELRALVPMSNADMIEAESQTGLIIHHVGKLAQALDVPVPAVAA